MTPQSPNEALQPEAAPPPPLPPPSRKRRRLSALSGFFSFTLIAAFAAMLAVIWGEHRLREPGPLASDKLVFIQKGSSTGEIIDKLAEQGVIDSPLTFQVAVLVRNIQGDKERLKAGEYQFKRQVSINEVLSILSSGKQFAYSITVPEGLTSQQIVQRLKENDVLTGEIRETPKEGSLLPETYKFVRGDTRGETLSRMRDAQKRMVDQVWARRSPDLPLRSPYELVTLASIVEKETGKADERSRVAGVFINRLRKRMRLQSDPTIVYGLVGGQGTLGHSISRAELDKPTPYNTYTIDGLPPGPIDNPGRAALEAVANPSRTADLYFVADGTGGHAFAETVDQHVKNVQRWRQIEHDAKEKGTGTDVDKVMPAAAPPGVAPRPNQRSDASDAAMDAVFGALPEHFDANGPKQRLASFVDPRAKHAIDGLAMDEAAPADPPPFGFDPAIAIKARSRQTATTRDETIKAATKKGEPSKSAAERAKPMAVASTFAISPGIESLGLSIQGARPSAADVLDGPVNAVGDEPAPAMPAPTMPTPTMPAPTIPAQVVATAVSSEPRDDIRLAEEKAKAARLGIDPPPDFATPASPPPLPGPVAPPEHPKIFDVSEGTALDPLRDKSYDLNSAKTIPDMTKPLP